MLDSRRMRVLAVETSTLAGGVALVDGERLIAEYLLDVSVTHSERLLAANQVRPTQTAVLTDVEKIAPGDPATESLREAKAIGESADPAAFERMLSRMGEVHRALLALGTPAASKVCKAIGAAEAAYHQGLLAALGAQGASADSKTTATARNVRDIDNVALRDFLRQTFAAETDLDIAQSGFISGGFSKFTASITLAGVKSLPTQIVLRGDAGATFGGSSVIDEYRTIKLMHEHGVCVPKPLALEASGKVFGSPFLLVEKKPGVVIGHMYDLPKTKDKATRRDVATQLAAIHRVPLSAVGNLIAGADTTSSAKALAWIDEGVNNWQPLNMPSPVFETAWDWLRRNVGINDKAPRGVVHGDCGLINVLIYDGKVSTILDWEFAHIGNPAYDLGYFYFMAEALYSWDEFLDAYGAAGAPVPDAAQLDYNILLATARLGVMTCQVSHLFTSGTQPGVAAAGVVGGAYYEETIRRLAFALDRVL